MKYLIAIISIMVILSLPNLVIAQGMGSSEFDYGGSGGLYFNYQKAIDYMLYQDQEIQRLEYELARAYNHEYKEFKNVFGLWAWAKEAWEDMPVPRGQNKCGDCSQWVVKRAHQDGYEMGCSLTSYQNGTAHFYNSTWIGDNFYMVDLYTPEPRVCWVSFKY